MYVHMHGLFKSTQHSNTGSLNHIPIPGVLQVPLL